MNQKNNQRYKDNQQVMEGVFLSLLEKKELSKITIQEICELAKVNRSTFYHHYEDIYDLMAKIERRLQKEFLDAVPYDQWHRSKQAYLDPEVLTLLIGHFAKYPEFYKQAMRNRHFGAMGDGFMDIWDNHFIPIFQGYGIQNERNMKYYFNFYLSGCLRVILDWLEAGCPESPRQIADIIVTFLPSSYTKLD